MRVEKDIYVPMRDGVSLAVDLYGPNERSTHAAVLIMNPYQKDAPFDRPLAADGRPVPSVMEIPEGFNPLLVGVEPLTESGFVVAVADARGTGYSEGVYDYYNLEGGPFDGYDLIEWLADQPWSTGQVGMMGASAGAIYCYITALTAPPHLKSMAPNMHPADFYFDQWRVGGVFRWENRVQWAMLMRAHTAPIDPGDPSSPVYERRRAIYEARFHRLGERMRAGKGIVDLDWLTTFYQRSSYDEMWRRMSFLRRIDEVTIPTLHGGVWFDHYIRGTISSHAAINAPKRLFVSPGSLATRTDLGDGGFSALTIEWFDHFLRGAPNAVVDGPSARVYLMGKEEYIDEPTWPVPSFETDLYLRAGPSGSSPSHNDGRLTATSPEAEPPDVIEHDPGDPVRSPKDIFDQRDFEGRCLTFTTDPLVEDLEVIGAPHVILYASIGGRDADWCVRLCDVDNSGRSKLVNTGALKASHSTSHEDPTPPESDETRCYDIEIWPLANLFRKGHRVRLDISNSDFPFYESNMEPSSNLIFHDEVRASHLLLPVVSRSDQQP